MAILSTMTELARQSVSAAKWALLSSLGKFVAQLLVSVAVARLLGPEAYGLFALAAIGLLIATFLSEIGLGWSLIQRPQIDDSVIRFVFTWQCLSGFAGCLIMVFGGALLADFLRDQRLVEVTQWLGLACIFNGFGATATNLLRRELRFMDLAKTQLISYALAYGVLGLPLAALGAGVWSLVVAWVAQAALNSILAFRARPHAWHPQLKAAHPGGFVDFGAAVLLTNICNWALTNLDRLLLGRIAGASSTGLYAVGYNLATVPNGLLTSALQPAFLASGARVQNEPERLSKAYLEVQGFIWIVVAPLFVLLAMAAPHITLILYGSAWLGSDQVFARLALAMPAYLALAMTTPVVWNTGRKWFELGFQLPVLLLAIPALHWACHGGVGRVAALAGGLFAVRFLLMLVVVCRALPSLSRRALLATAVRAFAFTFAVSAPAWLAVQAVSTYFSAPLALGGALIMCGLLPWLLVILFCPRMLGVHAVSLLARFIPKDLKWARAWSTRAALTPLKS